MEDDRVEIDLWAANRSVDVFVRKLREKIDLRSSRHTFLQTRYGVGYKFEPEPK